MMFMLQHLSEEKWMLVRNAHGLCYCCSTVCWLGGSIRWRDELELAAELWSQPSGLWAEAAKCLSVFHGPPSCLRKCWRPWLHQAWEASGLHLATPYRMSVRAEHNSPRLLPRSAQRSRAGGSWVTAVSSDCSRPWRNATNPTYIWQDLWMARSVPARDSALYWNRIMNSNCSSDDFRPISWAFAHT